MSDTKLKIAQLEATSGEFEAIYKKHAELVEEYNRLRIDYFTLKDIIDYSDPIFKKS